MTDEIKIIRGAKGQKSPPPPYRAPDTLHSRSFATLQDLISEGEIEGFASASKAGLTKVRLLTIMRAKKIFFLMILRY